MNSFSYQAFLSETGNECLTVKVFDALAKGRAYSTCLPSLKGEQILIAVTLLNHFANCAKRAGDDNSEFIDAIASCLYWRIGA